MSDESQLCHFMDISEREKRVIQSRKMQDQKRLANDPARLKLDAKARMWGCELDYRLSGRAYDSPTSNKWDKDTLAGELGPAIEPLDHS